MTILKFGLVEADVTGVDCLPQFMATRHTPAVTPLAWLRGASVLTNLCTPVAARKWEEQLWKMISHRFMAEKELHSSGRTLEIGENFQQHRLIMALNCESNALAQGFTITSVHPEKKKKKSGHLKTGLELFFVRSDDQSPGGKSSKASVCLSVCLLFFLWGLSWKKLRTTLDDVLQKETLNK